MARLLRPKILVPVVFSVALLAGLLGFADARRVVGVMMGFQHLYLLYFLLLMLAYEVVRGIQWHILLQGLGINVPLRAQIFTFAGGEVTKSLPIGNYFQNYLLQVSKGTDFGRSSAATTLIILIEVAVSLVGIVILGIGNWTWIRPLIMGGVLVSALLAWLAYRLYHGGALTMPSWLRQHDIVRKAVDEFRQFRAGVVDLLHPRILLYVIVLGAIYLLIAGLGFYLIVLGLGIGSVSIGQALAVYFFGLAAGLIVPLPVDIGVTEISATGAFLAVGLDRNSAVSIVLINRVLSIGASLAIALVVMVILNDELRAVLHDRTQSRERPAISCSSPNK